jgi:hypothetical protein|tara:strand:- start:955 stop:1587 length:633 start_codon:yes stop_codon:yes gene_type:complete
MTHAAPIWYGILNDQTVGGGGGSGGITIASAASGGADNACMIDNTILSDAMGIQYWLEDGSNFSSNAVTISIDGTIGNTHPDSAYWTTATTGGRGGGFAGDQIRVYGSIRNNGVAGSSYLWNAHSYAISSSYGSTGSISGNNTTTQTRVSWGSAALTTEITFASGRGGYVAMVDGDSVSFDVKGSCDGGTTWSTDYAVTINWTNSTGDQP